MGQGAGNVEQGEAAAGGPGRILLAEDDASLCRSLTRILAKGGYAVEAVQSGDAARDRIMAQEYDVILSDINMPGMTGPELLRECRMRWPHTEVVLMTGDPHLAAAVQCMKAGAFDYLEKPARGAALLAKIASAMASSRNRRRVDDTAPLTPPLPNGMRTIRCLGSGTMGIVLLVEKDGQPFAMKILRADATLMDSGTAHRRFCREATILSAIDHPGIVRVHDWGSTPAAQPFILMEYVDGKTLHELAAEGSLTQAQKLDILGQVGRAVQFVHERAIIHRDIKPSNVLVTPDLTVKLSDFGLARFVAGRSSMTLPGSVVGSPAYMAPETFSGAEPDCLSDIFSLGVLSYELLAGTSPFHGGDLQQIIYAVNHTTPPPLGSLTAGVPDALQRVVMRMIAKSPADRCQGVGEFLAALGQPCECGS
jgi:CheY-like chemotaxis protein/predicted Ser/Thr protein kinase